MNDPKPLLESSSPTARALLRAGLGDAPPPGALPRVTAALGLTAGTVAAAAPAAATVTVNGAAVVAVGGAGHASGASALVLGKWLLAGLAGGALVSGTASVVDRVHSGSASRVPVATASVRTQERVEARATEPAVAPAASLVPPVELPAAPTASAVATAYVGTNPPNVGSTTRSAADSQPSGTLGVEALRIDAARRALATGDARRALAELDAYQRVKVVGVLDREAAVLRVRAVLAAGDGARAAELAREYLEQRPRDAYQAELEAVIAMQAAKVPSRQGIDR